MPNECSSMVIKKFSKVWLACLVRMYRTLNSQVAGCLSKVVYISPDQKEFSLFRCPYSGAGGGYGGGGTDNQYFFHCVVTRFQKRENKAGSRSDSTCSQFG